MNRRFTKSSLDDVTNGALVGMEAPLIDYLHANFDVRVTSGTVNNFLMNLDPNLL